MLCLGVDEEKVRDSTAICKVLHRRKRKAENGDRVKESHVRFSTLELANITSR